MTSTCFNVTIDNGVAHIQMKRPEAFNSMTRAFWNELPAIVTDIDDNARARAIVISSTGKHFCSGMDLAVFTDDPILLKSGQALQAHVQDLLRLRLGQPIALQTQT